MRCLWIIFASLLVAACQPSAPAPLDEAGRALVQASQQRAASGDFQSALALADSAVTAYPQSFEALVQLGNVNFMLDQYGRAEQAFSEALAFAPEDGGIWVNLGNAYFRQQELEQAREAFRTATRHLDTPNPWLALAEIQDRLNEPDSARAALHTALRIDSTFVPARTRLATLEETEGNLTVALAEATQAFSLAPSDVDVAYRLGTLHLKLGEAEAAAPLLSSVAQREPWNFSALFNLGQAMQRLGQAEDAQRILDRAAQVRDMASRVERLETDSRARPDDLGLRLRHAEGLRSLGRLREALSAYQVAAASQPDDLRILHNIATLHLNLGDTTAARMDYETILAEDSTYVDALVNLAVYFNQQGKRPTARRYLQQAYRHGGPDHPALQRLQASVQAD
ncbi:MAG: tetratricopeptide repeat protein [Bacteroidota bacterium]